MQPDKPLQTYQRLRFICNRPCMASLGPPFLCATAYGTLFLASVFFPLFFCMISLWAGGLMCLVHGGICASFICF
ncbi:hypothetical protein BDV25DRAFT_152822 [Aspergillus avenaceus]|uniref:Uncharacterized protein n=1 Tax=Aspergillus avenaceus TaxID=36643 RepID=A0A5N6TY07_ASPAV|nr:hypothetical protein BDV25DRAFT_152822 [Aspergillus avenaceus]